MHLQERTVQRNCLPCETVPMRSKKYELYSTWIPLVYILQKRSVCSKIFLIISNGFHFCESFDWWRKFPISSNDTLLSLVAYSTNDVRVGMKLEHSYMVTNIQVEIIFYMNFSSVIIRIVFYVNMSGGKYRSRNCVSYEFLW